MRGGLIRFVSCAMLLGISTNKGFAGDILYADPATANAHYVVSFDGIDDSVDATYDFIDPTGYVIEDLGPYGVAIAAAHSNPLGGVVAFGNASNTTGGVTADASLSYYLSIVR